MSNVQIIVDFLRGKGASNNLIAAALGNLRVESSFDPGSYNGKEGAHGIVQWEGPRYPALLQYTQAHGLNANSLQGQLEFMWHELTTSYHSTFQQIQNASSAYQAGLIWAQSYEGCASDTWTERANNAANYLQNNLKGLGGESSNQSGGPGGGGGGGGGNGASGGHVDYRSIDSLGSLLQQVPELKQLVDEAQSGNWTLGKFENAVENSNWWQNHSESARSALIQQANDPATWTQRLRQAEFSVNLLSNQLGFQVAPDQLRAIASSAILSGNDGNQQWLTAQLGRRTDYSNLTNLGSLQGGMANTADQLSTLAADYGVRLDPSRVAHQAKMIEMGNQTIDTYKQRYMQWAISAFPGLAKQLQDGTTTLKDLADPYVQSMSSLLEVAPSQLNTYTPLIRQALQGTQDKNGDRVVTPLWQFENQVRQDPRWRFTDNAMSTVASVATQLGQTWGFNG